MPRNNPNSAHTRKTNTNRWHGGSQRGFSLQQGFSLQMAFSSQMGYYSQRGSTTKASRYQTPGAPLLFRSKMTDIARTSFRKIMANIARTRAHTHTHNAHARTHAHTHAQTSHTHTHDFMVVGGLAGTPLLR